MDQTNYSHEPSEKKTAKDFSRKIKTTWRTLKKVFAKIKQLLSPKTDSNGKRSFTKKQKKMIKRLSVVVIAFILAIVLIIYAISSLFHGIAYLCGAPARKQEISRLVAQTDTIAAGYDYDKAIETVKSYEKYEKHTELTDAINRYESAKNQLITYPDNTQITHVFFHTLIKDNQKAFDGDNRADGYNQYMTTISEFNKMMEEMYNRGFVLVNLYDVAGFDENNVMRYKEIRLPAGKKPFVMSQDDVSYYTYMTTDGFASRLVIGDDGYPTCEYVNDDGSVERGAFDLVPLLENFIQEHPDFSYKGARATLAITGYDGVLGYRTSPTGDGYDAASIEQAKAVASRMKELGWTFASHSWGHQKYGKISFDKMKTDADRWESEVEPILGKTDILIYANGDDISSKPYTEENEKFKYLKVLGFDYYCPVDSSVYANDLGETYFRQGRRNLDGYRMFYSPDRLADLFEVDKVWDSERPTPVKQIS